MQPEVQLKLENIHELGRRVEVSGGQLMTRNEYILQAGVYGNTGGR